MEVFKAFLEKVIIDNENIILKMGPIKDKFLLSSIIEINLQKEKDLYILYITFRDPSDNRKLQRSLTFWGNNYSGARKLFDRIIELCPQLPPPPPPEPTPQYNVGPIKCPNCGSTQVDSHKRYTGQSSINGRKDITITCLNCGYQWHPGSAPQNLIPIEPEQKPEPSEKDDTVDLDAELTKYKQLFDKGLITEADYEAKKKQLLGL